MKKNRTLPLEIDATGEFLTNNPISSEPVKTDREPSIDPAAELLAENLCFLWSHKEQILFHPQMAFAKVSVGHNLAITGTSRLRGATLGVVLEWLTRCPQTVRIDATGSLSLMYFFAGSPLSGCNQCVFINTLGIREALSVHPFRPVWETFMDINEDYFFQDLPDNVLTLEEVIQRLQASDAEAQ